MEIHAIDARVRADVRAIDAGPLRHRGAQCLHVHRGRAQWGILFTNDFTQGHAHGPWMCRACIEGLTDRKAVDLAMVLAIDARMETPRGLWRTWRNGDTMRHYRDAGRAIKGV